MESVSERWTRVALSIVLFVIAATIYYAWKIGSGNTDYSIVDLIQGKVVPEETTKTPESFTVSPGPSIDLNDVQLLSRLNEEYSLLIQAVVPSVVSINTSKSVSIDRYYSNPLGLTKRTTEEYLKPGGLGSGVIVTREGHIITNHHLIADAAEIVVTVHGGRKYRAEILRSDPRADLAVLKITGGVSEEFQAIPIGDSDGVRVGEMVFAVGNPFGFSESVTQGVISGKERRFTDADTGFFQTDTVINPGSSGGPLINLRGELIGINVYIYAGATGVRTWQGVGLAIPSNDAFAYFKEVMRGGRPSRGYLGIGVEDIYPDIILRMGLKNNKGAVVMEVVPDSPAEHAGIKPDDVILSFNEEAVENTSDLIRRVREQPVNSKVRIGLVRNRFNMEFHVTIGERSTEIRLAGVDKSKDGLSRRPVSEVLGVDVSTLPPEEKARRGLLPDQPAVIITRISSSSPAGKILRPGDLIHEINRTPINTREEFLQVIDSIPASRDSSLLVSRNGVRTFVVLQTSSNSQ